MAQGTIERMAWEWVAPISTAVVGVTGIAATYFSGKRQATTARDVAKAQADAALAAQREERNQRRIEAAYPPLLDVLTEGTHWVWRADSYVLDEALRHEPSPPMPEAVKALGRHGPLAAVWSPTVASLVRDWSHGAAVADTRARMLTTTARGQPTTSHAVYLGERFNAGRDEMLRAEARIRDQVWRELRGERDGLSA